MCSPTRLTLVALSTLALALPARAETFKVPKQHATIQAALDAAGPGDTVEIAPGAYAENLVISPGRDGLTLRAKGSVYLDAHQGDTGLWVRSHDVTITGLSIRHAKEIGLLAELNPADADAVLEGITLDKIVVLNTVAGVRLVAHDALLKGCRVAGLDNGIGVEVIGDRAQVTRTTVAQTEGDQVAIKGDDAVVAKCRLGDNYSGEGVSLTGDRGRIVDNEFVNIDYSAIAVNGDDAVVRGNEVLHVHGDVAIDVTGLNPTVVDNTVVFVGGGYSGFEIASEGDGGRVEGNRIDRATASGIEVSGDDMTIRKNRVTQCGGWVDSSGAGLYVDGDRNLVESNTVKRHFKDGLTIDGDDNLVVKNKVQDSLEDGIYVDSGKDNIFEHNSVSGSQAEGFDNGGTATVLRKNKIQGNRIDIANDGTIEIAPSNKFKTGGEDQTPEV